MTISSKLSRVITNQFIVGIVLVVFAAMPVHAEEIITGYSLQADGLACPFCAYGIEKQLSAIDGVNTVGTNIKTGTVLITMKDGVSLEEDAARLAVEAAGFTMRNFQKEGDDE